MLSLCICQWNCRSAVSNKINLIHLLSSNNIDIAVLCETWFKPGVYMNFPGYNVVREDRQDGKGGVAVLLKNKFAFSEIRNIHKINNVSSTGVSLQVNKNLSINIVSIYVPPRTSISVQQWNNFLSSIPKPFILAGDFNAHHTYWGCGVTDSFGRKLLEAMDNQDVIYLNDSSPTLVKSLNAIHSSAPDLTICSDNIAGLFDWNVLSDPHGSDHLPIIINGNITPKSFPPTPSRKWNINKANWMLYSAQTELVLDCQAPTLYKTFIEVINRAADQAIPTIKPSQQHIKHSHCPKPWWNSECQNSVDKRKNLFEAYKQTPTATNYFNYKKQDAIVKKITKEAKRNSWRQYCASLNKNTPMKQVWHKLRKYKNSRRENHIPISKHDEWVSSMLQRLAPDWVYKPLPAVYEDPSHSSEVNYLLKPFSLSELIGALKINSNTAPGRDNIHYPMLVNLPVITKKYILRIFNSLWVEKVDPPDDWYDYVVVLLRKPNKEPNDINSYRPIALSSCILKTYERLIKNRLEYWLESNKKLASSQFGFRKGKSINEAIIHLVSDINIALSRNHMTSAIFIDIQAAFDSVNLNILAEKMVNIGLPHQVVHNIMKLYTRRNIYIKANDGLLGPRTAHSGLPQGSILSPSLYLIYTYDIESICHPSTCIIQFADDICLYSTSDVIDKANSSLEASLVSLHNWTVSNALSISEQKSVFTVFKRQRFTLPNTIKLGHYNIPYKSSVKYLGIHLDSKLNWKTHVQLTIKKAENALNVLKAFCNSKWGSDPNITLIFYRSLIRSILDYGSLFYASASATTLRKIDTFKNKCLRTCIGFLKTTPVVAMEAETIEPPLSLRRQFLSDKFILNLQSQLAPAMNKICTLSTLTLTSPYWRVKTSPAYVNSFIYLSEFQDVVFSSHGPQCYTIDYELYDCHLVTNSPTDPTDTPTRLRNSIFQEEVGKKWPGFHTIFTDGSKEGENIGCAFYDSTKNVSGLYKLPKEASIYTAELTAIKEAMNYCQQQQEDKFIIFTDSKSSVDALQKPKIHSGMTHLIKDILLLHGVLTENNKTVKLAWLRGHSGIDGNETADSLAKSANKYGAAITNFKIPASDLMTKLKNKMLENWNQSFMNSSVGRPYRSIQPSIPRKPWFHDTIDRNFIKTICRIRTNHALFPKYKHMLNLSTTDECICGDTADLQHLFLECPILNSDTLIYRVSLLGICQPFNLSYLLALNRADIHKELYKFSSAANLKL